MNRLFEASLERSSDIIVALLDRFFRVAFGTEPLDQAFPVEFSDRRLATPPRHLRFALVMDEMLEAEMKPELAVELYDLLELVAELRLPVRAEPHDLVLVAVLPEPEILRQSGVEDAQ